MRGLTLITLTLANIVLALDVTGKSKTITTSTNYNEKVTIDKGVYLGLVGGNYHNFFSDLTVHGGLYVSTDDSTVGKNNQLKGSFKNDFNTVIDLEDDTRSNAFLWEGSSFQNMGNMSMRGTPYASSKSQSLKFSSFSNSGFLQFFDTGYLQFGKEDGTIRNTGTIAGQSDQSNHMYLIPQTSMVGNGCLWVGSYCIFYIEDLDNITVEDQTIVLSSDPNAIVLGGSTDPFSKNPPVTSLKIRNFNSKTSIWFHDSNPKITSFSNGILTVATVGRTYKLDVGSGYSSDQFTMTYTQVTTQLWQNGRPFSGGVLRTKAEKRTLSEYPGCIPPQPIPDFKSFQRLPIGKKNCHSSAKSSITSSTKASSHTMSISLSSGVQQSSSTSVGHSSGTSRQEVSSSLFSSSTAGQPATDHFSISTSESSTGSVGQSSSAVSTDGSTSAYNPSSSTVATESSTSSVGQSSSAVATKSSTGFVGQSSSTVATEASTSVFTPSSSIVATESSTGFVGQSSSAVSTDASTSAFNPSSSTAATEASSSSVGQSSSSAATFSSGSNSVHASSTLAGHYLTRSSSNPSSSTVSTEASTSSVSQSSSTVATETSSSSVGQSSSAVATESSTGFVGQSSSAVSTDASTSAFNPSSSTVATEASTSAFNPSSSTVAIEASTSAFTPSSSTASTESSTSAFTPSSSTVATEASTSAFTSSSSAVASEGSTSSSAPSSKNLVVSSTRTVATVPWSNITHYVSNTLSSQYSTRTISNTIEKSTGLSSFQYLSSGSVNPVGKSSGQSADFPLSSSTRQLLSTTATDASSSFSSQYSSNVAAGTATRSGSHLTRSTENGLSNSISLMSSHSTIAVSSVASSSRHSTASALSTSGSQYFGKETSHRSIHSTTQTPVQSLSKASLGSETSTAELSTFTTSTTVYKEWTGTFTSTYSTQVSTMVERTSEGPDGKVTIEIIYYVETPLTREASSTATTNPSSASLPRISNIATIANERTTMVTVTSCNSHFCTETVSPAIISTVTTNVKNIVTEYTTWCPISATAALEQTTEETMTSSVFDAYSKSVSAAVASTAALTNGNDAITKGTIGHPIATETTVVPSSRASDSEDAVVSGSTKTAIPNSSTSIIAEVSTRSAIALGSDVSSTSTVIKVTSGAAIIPEPATSQTNFQTHITTYFTTNSQQPQVSSSRSSSNTVSLQLSSYAGIANNLISHSAWSVFIASILLAIV